MGSVQLELVSPARRALLAGLGIEVPAGSWPEGPFPPCAECLLRWHPVGLCPDAEAVAYVWRARLGVGFPACAWDLLGVWP